jgi:hypothetical protein
MAPSAQPEGSTQPLTPVQTQIGLQALAEIAEAWGLTTDDQLTLLGSPPRSTFFKWRKEGGVLPKDTQERLSHLLNIYRVLQILIPNPQEADRWMKQPNRAFNNESALQRALGGSVSHLIEVRRYLDGQRG